VGRNVTAEWRHLCLSPHRRRVQWLLRDQIVSALPLAQ
jgi:hypothetical protein